MKQKLLLLFLALLTAITASAHSFAVANDDGVTIYYNKNSDGSSVYVTFKDYEYNSYSGAVNIPSTVTYNGTTYSVTSIGEHAFDACTGLTSLTIPNSVATIGKCAFEDCNGLTSVTIGNSVTSIGSYAFNGCSGLTSVIIGNSVTSIGYKAFSGCTRLTSVTIPNSVTIIGYEAFSGCTRLTSVTIPNSVTIIGEKAFYNTALYKNDSNWVNNVLYIGNHLIVAKSGLSGAYTIKEGTIIIANSAFESCSGLTSVTIGNSVTSIGSYAFNGCSGLTSVTIPNSVTSIGSYAFSGCSGLTSVTIPNSVTSIANRAFSGCSGLTSVTIPNSVTSIGSYAFNGCSGLTSVTIPNSVTSIGDYAFNGCSGLTSVTIPNSVTSIGDYAFSGCTGLTQVNALSETAPNDFENSFEDVYSTATLNIPDGALQSYLNTDYWYLFENIKAGDTALSRTNDDVFAYITNPQTKEAMLTAINDKTMTTVTIPSRVVVENGEDATFYQVTVIGQSAFKDLTSIASIKLPANLTAIYNNAFNGCTSLTAITLPSKVSFIGNSAFQGCTGFTSIEFPESLTTLGNSAFQGCSKLASVAFPESLTTLGNSAFQGCSKLASVTFPENTLSIGEKAFYSCPMLSEINAISATTIGASAFESSKVAEVNITAETIGENCFKWCSSLTSATINCPMIGGGAFYGCSDLASVAHTAETIDSQAFYGTSKLAGFDFATVKTIGSESFRNSGLTEAVITRSVESIGKYAFQNCSKLKTFVIQDGTEAIELDNSIVYGSPIANLYVGRNYEGTAFASNGMTALVIGNAVTELPEGAFQSSTSLKKVEIGSMLEAIPANAFKGCTALADIVVPRNVATIGANAFDGCTAIGNISIGCGTTEIGELAFNEVNAAASVCVAAVDPPTANNNSFSNYNVPLYVPEGSTDAYYNYPRCWYRFEPDALKVISDVTIDGAGAIADLKVGDTVKLVAAFEPADATLPYIFWRSTNPGIATVDSEGNVTFLGATETEGDVATMSEGTLECQIIAETLYDDAPVATVTISGSSAGINVIVDDSSNSEFNGGSQRPNDIYNLQGICLKRNASQADIDALTPGLYIIGGKKMIVK